MGGTLTSQPQNHHGKSDDVINKVAEAISDDGDIRKLGSELLLRHSAISKAIAKNWEHNSRSTDGNKMMLFKWANKLERSDLLVPTLKAALVRAGLTEIAETCIPSAGNLPSPFRRQTSITKKDTSSSRRHYYDRVIYEVAEAISDDKDLRKLGLVLGLNQTAIVKAVDVNREDDGSTKLGNIMMLQKWANTVNKSQQRDTLRDALRRAKLHAIEEACFQKAGAEETIPDDIKTLREKLKTRYLKKYGEIKTSPVDPESRKWLRTIFVSLVLKLVSSVSEGNEEGKPMDIDDLYKMIKNKTSKGFATRFAFLGKVGVGKTTIFSKIAFDWAMGDCLQDINLLFLESFQEIKDYQCFGNIVMNHFPDISHIKGTRIDEYIHTNQRKVVILIVDLVDEEKVNFSNPDHKNAVVSIVRGDKFSDTPVLITTRPFEADLLKSIDNIRELYTLIEVIGFKLDGTKEYIEKFFKEDKQSGKSLIEFILSHKVVLELLAPYPIFCSMLCHIWNIESGTEMIKKLGRWSVLVREICFSLLELYCSKYRGKVIGYEDRMSKATDTIIKVGYVALECLLKNQDTFDEESIDKAHEEVINSLRLACDIGILSREKRLAPREIRQRLGKQFIEKFCFPHKLLQEYVASKYLAFMYEAGDTGFNEILEKSLLIDYNKYRHVLYFVASHGEKVGKSLMEALCKRVDNMSLAIEVAFECQHIGALDPVKKWLNSKLKKTLVPDFSTEHIFSAHIFALQTFAKEEIEEVKHTENTLNSLELYHDGPSRYAKALCNMPQLRSLELSNDEFKEEHFYSAMAADAKMSKIMTLRHTNGRLGTDASAQYAKAVVSLPKLQTFELNDVKLGDEFYPAMAEGASTSRIENLRHMNGCLSPASSANYAKAVVSMPKLQTFELNNVNLDDIFFPAMAEGASTSQIETLKHVDGNVGPAASAHYARSLYSMPNLRNLELSEVKLGDDFYLPTLTSNASKSKIVNLKHVGRSLTPAASSNYARSLCSMPCLQSLEMEGVGVDNELFYQAMAKEAAKSKIEVMRHADAELGPAASSHYAQSLLSMSRLRSLELDRVKLDDTFFISLYTKATPSKITNLRHVDGKLSSSSSHHYALWIFAMPKLRSLELSRMKLGDSFFKAMATQASNSKIEKLRQIEADLGYDASERFATGLCLMPKLQSLELHTVKLTDEFSVAMAKEACHSKIQVLRMDWCAVNRRVLNAVLSLPHLEKLRLVGIYLTVDEDDKQLSKSTPVKELHVGGRFVADLWKLGLHTSCPHVKTLALYFHEMKDESSETIRVACSPFKALSELRIHLMNTLDPTEFCKAISSSCPQLTKLVIVRTKLYDEKADLIIQSLKEHPHLTSIRMDSCSTDRYLDPTIAGVNKEGKLTVTVVHGPEDSPKQVIHV